MKPARRFAPLAFALAAIATLAITAPAAMAAPAGKRAPEWDISEWINSEPLSVAQLRGKVIVVEFFQLWCPGCNSFSIPLMKKWGQIFKQEESEGRLVFVSIHTVFEGRSVQTPERLRRFLKKKNIRHPVGIDRHIGNNRLPETMQRYNTMGTPEMAIIGKLGNIRFQRFGFFESTEGEQVIRALLDEKMEPENVSLTR